MSGYPLYGCLPGVRIQLQLCPCKNQKEGLTADQIFDTAIRQGIYDPRLFNLPILKR